MVVNCVALWTDEPKSGHFESSAKRHLIGLDTIIFRLEQVASHVIRLSDVNLVDNEIEHLVTDTIGKLQRLEQFNSVSPFTVGAVYSGQPGRPCLDISFDQLNYFLNYSI